MPINTDSVSELWSKVQDDKDETNWCLFTVSDDGKSLEPVGSGSGGVMEMRENLDEARVSFGAFLVKGVDDREATTSVRSKFVFVVYIGPSTSVLKKAKVSTLKGDVAAAFRGHHVNIESSDLDDFDAEHVVKKLLTAGGAHKPTRYEFSSELSIPVDHQ